MTYDLSKLQTGGIVRRDPARPGQILIVLVHGFRAGTIQWQPLLTLAKEDDAFDGCDFLVFNYSTRVRNRQGLERIGHVLADAIELHHKNYSEIVLVGYSLGGLIVRSAFLTALGVSGARQKSSWSSEVSRIVLMATPNRGLGGRGTRWRHRLELGFTRAFAGQTLRDALKGSDFITRLRLDWVYAYRDPEVPTPQVVQLLGGDDQYVTPRDSNDVTSFKNGKLFMVGGAKHEDLAQYTGTDDDRYVRLKRAALEPIDDVVGDEEPLDAAKVPSAVVFELHGIRDYGGWLDRFANTIRQIDQGVRVEKPAYGYFSIIDFVIPSRRRRRIAWFCDRYTEQVAAMAATDVDVPFLAIGHSYGTYLIAECLRRFPQMRFRRACFVGSVVPEAFPPWRTILGGKQLLALRNDCATHDWPVAICCRVLNQIGFKDIGRGGFVGFRIGVDEAIDHLHIEGNHSATLTTEEGRRSAAQFLLGQPTSWPKTVDAPRWMWSLSHWALPLLVIAAAVAILGGIPLVDHVAHWINIAPHMVVALAAALLVIFLIYV